MAPATEIALEVMQVTPSMEYPSSTDPPWKACRQCNTVHHGTLGYKGLTGGYPTRVGRADGRAGPVDAQPVRAGRRRGRPRRRLRRDLLAVRDPDRPDGQAAGQPFPEGPPAPVGPLEHPLSLPWSTPLSGPLSGPLSTPLRTPFSTPFEYPLGTPTYLKANRLYCYIGAVDGALLPRVPDGRLGLDAHARLEPHERPEVLAVGGGEGAAANPARDARVRLEIPTLSQEIPTP